MQSPRMAKRPEYGGFKGEAGFKIKGSGFSGQGSEFMVLDLILWWISEP
jgi:hypothetical protein